MKFESENPNSNKSAFAINRDRKDNCWIAAEDFICDFTGEETIRKKKNWEARREIIVEAREKLSDPHFMLKKLSNCSIDPENNTKFKAFLKDIEELISKQDKELHQDDQLALVKDQDDQLALVKHHLLNDDALPDIEIPANLEWSALFEANEPAVANQPTTVKLTSPYGTYEVDHCNSQVLTQIFADNPNVDQNFKFKFAELQSAIWNTIGKWYNALELNPCKFQAGEMDKMTTLMEDISLVGIDSMFLRRKIVYSYHVLKAQIQANHEAVMTDLDKSVAAALFE
ncbi:hypothetical protein V6N13_132871 [Hibiscus sabdariffa]|uniref:Uncharacterized protein n=1 Tax=Hibiscus sabdariffa TaxID=183260 RepID=A0ABR2PX97_9ROSI